LFIYVISKIKILKSKTWRCIKHGNVTQKNIEKNSYNKNKLQVDSTLALQHTLKLQDLIIPIKSYCQKYGIA